MNTQRMLIFYCILVLAILSCNLFSPAASPDEFIVPELPNSEELVPTELPLPVVTDSPTTESPTPEIVMIGHLSLDLGEAANTIQTESAFVVHVNTVVPNADLLLVTINALDGPMPGLREQMILLDGKTLARVAILLINTDIMDDPELQQLELLETRELLYRYMDSQQADQLIVLVMPDPDITSKLKALLILPPVNIEVHAPPE